ncbi:D-alanyl-D-alanine carboxypeptidase family protein, partial [Nostoc sp. NIES-2111]
GSVLLEKSPDTPFQPASLAKLMTIDLTLEALSRGDLQPDQEVPISRRAWQEGGAGSGGSTMFAKVGSSVPVIDLLRGVIVQSGNDAAIALAEALAGSSEAFVTRMNARAAALGMAATHFANPTGYFDPDQKVSARDLAILARHLVQAHPAESSIFAERQFTWNRISQPNRNPLLDKVPGADGLKTGFLKEAGYSLVGSAVQQGRRVIAVLAGYSTARDRATDSARVFQWAFRNFEVRHLFDVKAPVADAEVFAGSASTVSLVLPHGLDVVVEKSGPPLKLRARYEGPLRAPVRSGDAVGRIVVRQGGRTIAEAPLVAGAAVERDGFVGQATDAALELTKQGFRDLVSEVERRFGG